MTSTPLIKQLLERRRLVFGYVYALTRDVDSAEEIFQEVSVAVLEESGRGASVDRFLPWVCTIARNRSMDYYRRKGKAQPVSAVLAETVAEVFEQQEESGEDAARRIRGLLDCVEALPGRQRQLVELYYRDQLQIAQVAASIGWKRDAVKVGLSKIRKALLDCLRGKGLIPEAELS